VKGERKGTEPNPPPLFSHYPIPPRQAESDENVDILLALKDEDSFLPTAALPQPLRLEQAL
jgi:hypothetical protein